MTSVKMLKSIGFGALAPSFFACSAASSFAFSSLKIIVGLYRADAEIINFVRIGSI